MLWSKVRCGQCEHYSTCPLKTRLFINYCGSHTASVASRIQAAISDCRARRAYFVRQRRTTLLNTPRTAGSQV